MIELQERDGLYYAAANDPLDEDRLCDAMRRHGSCSYDAESLSWRISQACYEELKEYAITAGEVGSALKLPLFPYQKETVSFCLDKGSALIVLPCGSGKTPIGISLYLDAIRRKLIQGPGLVVVKATLKTQWGKEVEKFSNLRAKILDTEKSVCSGIQAKARRRQKKIDETDAVISCKKTADHCNRKCTFCHNRYVIKQKLSFRIKFFHRHPPP